MGVLDQGMEIVKGEGAVLGVNVRDLIVTNEGIFGTVVQNCMHQYGTVVRM